MKIDPRSICDRYTDDTYAKMRDDNQRTEAYAAAIAEVADGRVALDIGTGALALLAVMAAKAGAKHVYAVEANEQAYQAAVQTVADQGLSDRVTILHGFSTDVTLPERVDLLLHEIIGEVGGAEGVAAAVLDASARHLMPPSSSSSSSDSSQPTLSVPARARTLLGPAEFPGPEYFASLPYPMLAAPGARALKLPSLPRSVLLAEPQTFEDLRFESATPLATQDVELQFEMARAGTLRGLALHVEVFLLDGDAAEPEVSSAVVGSHWPNVFLMLREPIEAAAGMRVSVRARSALDAVPAYTFEVSIEGKPVDEMRYPEL